MKAFMFCQITTLCKCFLADDTIVRSFTGMKGVIGFERLGPRSTEVSFTGDFQAKELPLPKVLMSFALEVVTQKVAESMRHYIETQTL